MRGKKSLKSGKRGKSNGQGFYPLLRWLGMEERVSPLVWIMTAQTGMLASSFSQAQHQLKDWGIQLSEKRIQRLSYCFGRIGLNLTEQWMEQLKSGNLRTGRAFQGKRIVVSADGGRTRLRRSKKGKRRHSKRRGYYGDWREPKLLTLYAVDEQGHRLDCVEVPIVNDGTFCGVEVFMELLEMYCVQLGIIHAQEVLLVADGAHWIWKRIPALLKRLGLAPEKLIELIDFYHASSQLKDFAQAAFKGEKQAQQWFEQGRKWLKHGHLKRLWAEMKKLKTQKHSQKKRKILSEVYKYFQDQVERFNYKGVKAKNLPIGSGAIESLIRQVVNLRLKGNGKFWSDEHAEILLHGRCQWAAHRWDQYCRSVLTAKLDPQRLSVMTSEVVGLLPV